MDAIKINLKKNLFLLRENWVKKKPSKVNISRKKKQQIEFEKRKIQ